MRATTCTAVSGSPNVSAIERCRASGSGASKSGTRRSTLTRAAAAPCTMRNARRVRASVIQVLPHARGGLLHGLVHERADALLCDVVDDFRKQRGHLAEHLLLIVLC